MSGSIGENEQCRLSSVAYIKFLNASTRKHFYSHGRRELHLKRPLTWFAECHAVRSRSRNRCTCKRQVTIHDVNIINVYEKESREREFFFFFPTSCGENDNRTIHVTYKCRIIINIVPL